MALSYMSSLLIQVNTYCDGFHEEKVNYNHSTNHLIHKVPWHQLIYDLAVSY